MKLLHLLFCILIISISCPAQISWKKFTTKEGLPDNTIFKLFEDSRGQIWIATGNGIARFDNESWKTFPELKNMIENGKPYKFIEDEQGNLWFYSLESDKGLVKFDGTTFHLFDKNNGLADNGIRQIAFDNLSRLWVLPKNPKKGFSMFDGNTWKMFEIQIGNAIDYPNFLSLGNKVALSTTLDGVALFDGCKMTKFDMSNGLPSERIFDICLDSKDNFWVATKKGVARYNGSEWKVFDSQNSSIPDDKIYKVFEDSDKNIWISTDPGLLKLTDGKWELFKHDEKSSEGIWAIKYDGAGNKWIVTRTQFILFKNGKEIAYDAVDEFQKQATWFHLFPDGRIYLLLTLSYTGDEVFYVFDGSGWKLQAMLKAYKAKNNFIEDYTIDDKNVFWFATLWNGLKSFDGENWTVYSKKENFFSNDIYTVLFDKKKRLWVGSKDDGLLMKE